MEIRKYVMRWKKMSQSKKIGFVVAGIVAIGCVGFVGGKVYPRIQTFFLLQNHGYHMTPAEKKEFEAFTQELKTPVTETEKKELYEQTDNLRNIVAKLKTERKEDQQFYQEYVENGEKLLSTNDREFVLEYKQHSQFVYDTLTQDIMSLKDNFESIQKEYEMLEKEHGKSSKWKAFDSAYRDAEQFLKEEKSLDVLKKKTIEEKLLKTYLALYNK